LKRPFLEISFVESTMGLFFQIEIRGIFVLFDFKVQPTGSGGFIFLFHWGRIRSFGSMLPDFILLAKY